jgi:flagellar basal body-associated protein FliL
MNKVQNRILTVLLTVITFPICGYVFSFVWDYFKLSSLKNDNIFIYTSECDPEEKEPTIIVFLIIFIFSVLLSKFIIYLLNINRNKTQKSTTN